MIPWMYRWLPIIFGCHCKEERSFYYRDKKFPICARCTGELVGILISIFSCFFFRVSVGMSLLLMLPLVIDGSVQMISKYESNNIRRCWTGILFGFALFMFLADTTIMAFNFGLNLAVKNGW